MHDIGKVKTPNEVLNKPGKLTDAEFDILKRHTVDGAEILKNTPEIPPLGPIVAFEHHLRSDGTGYPPAPSRPQLNLATTLVRHRRRLRRDALAARLPAGPPDRSHPGGAAAQRRQAVRPAPGEAVRPARRHLPAGNLVRLDTGEIAVVLKAYAPDPYRPRVKVLTRGRPEAGASLRRQPVGGARRPAAVGAGAGRSGHGRTSTRSPISSGSGSAAPGSGSRLAPPEAQLQ